MDPIALVAAACEFPEARTPGDLWQLALHGRRTFRRLPPQRLAMSDYARGDTDPDSIYPIEAALIEGYAFDRDKFLVPKPLFAGADLSHWMALDVATRALTALDRHGGITEVRDATAVIVANTLTGEFGRANLLRYRWPYVERTVRAVAGQHLDNADIDGFLQALEDAYKAPFPAPDEDSLAGGLSNTIAGRIANHHGLRGGAHTVDGACASSLVAVLSACDRLAAGDISCAVVGAVDLSLDPFELVGFARNGALSRSVIRVFDRDSDGFSPGEGCGFVILATASLVKQRGWPVLGWILGTGMSTDGAGGLTRPSIDGQLLALRRAWSRAGLGADSADYFEAHGTGTPTGDPVELSALARLLETAPPQQPVPVGSIKANIGHTKAAAGMAGLLKALAVCSERVVPATSGCPQPHPLFDDPAIGSRVCVTDAARRIAHDRPVTVGINSFGFGGVNCHVVLQGTAAAAPAARALTPLPQACGADLPGELFTIHAGSRADLVHRLQQLETRARFLSRSQLADLAAALPAVREAGWRACIVAQTPQALEQSAHDAIASLSGAPAVERMIGARFSWSGPATTAPRIGFLFPGQGLQVRVAPGRWARRFACLTEPTSRLEQALAGDPEDTAVMQPLLAELSLAGLALLAELGIAPSITLGHSFGELPALHAAGHFDAQALRALALARGTCMRDLSPPGSMLAVEADGDTVLRLAAEHDVDLACVNAEHRFVVAGTPAAIAACAVGCARLGLPARMLPTTRAFHSRLMTEPREAFVRALSGHRWQDAQVEVISTVSGCAVESARAIPDLLAAQFLEPVRFDDALRALGPVDLLLEIGAGNALSGLAEQVSGRPALPLTLFGDDLDPLLAAIGAVWVCGGSVDTRCLYEGRLLRPCALEETPDLLASPCGTSANITVAPRAAKAAEPLRAPALPSLPGASVLETLRAAISEVTGLPRERIDAGARLLADLHLNSIRARHIVTSVARNLGIERMPFNLEQIANASVGDITAQLEQMRSAAAANDAARRVPDGVAPWLRLFGQAWMAGPGPRASAAPWQAKVFLDDTLAPLPAGCRAQFEAGLAAPDDSAGCVLLVLPAEPSPAVAEAILSAAQRAAGARGDGGADDDGGLLVVQGAQHSNAFLRSVAAEQPWLRLCAVEYEQLDPGSLRTAIDEFRQQRSGYSEMRLRGTACERRVLKPIAAAAPAPAWVPGADDVLVVTGGARGIGAASVRFIAARYGCRIAMIGRSAPDATEVQATLDSLRRHGDRIRYFRADLSIAAEAAAVLPAIERQMGPVTALIHAAGVNRPASLHALTSDALHETLSSKLESLDNLLDHVPAGQLRLLIGYGSIIGELGLAGEAHYALANEWLSRRVTEWSRDEPQCIGIPIGWSAWREVGMAARLEGVLDSLADAGTRPLEIDEATGALARLIESPPQVPVIVAGRYGRAIDPGADLRLLQRYRYLEQPQVFYPAVELVADAQVSSDCDRYLIDHAPYGVPLLPLVCAIEAMASAAMTLCATDEPPTIEDLHIGEAVSCAFGQRFVLRTCALVHEDIVHEDRTVEVQIRSETTGFDVVHYSARLRWPGRLPPERRQLPHDRGLPAHELLYSGLAFHGPRFQRLSRFASVQARSCVVHAAPGAPSDWYAPLLPRTFAAGDPGIRDAVIHALQACIPHCTVLPLGVERITAARLDPDRAYVICARETGHGPREFTFDIDVCEPDGTIVERWTGLRLTRVTSNRFDAARQQALPLELVEPFLERLSGEVLDSIGVGVGVSSASVRAEATAEAVGRAAGHRVGVDHDADGALRVDGMRACATHAGDVTIALTHRDRPVAVDLEFLPSYPEQEWRALLGDQRHRFATRLAAAGPLSMAQACLATWTASECLLKLGRHDWPLQPELARWNDTLHTGLVVDLRSGSLRLAVAFFRLAGGAGDAALAMAIDDAHADPAASSGPAVDRGERNERSRESESTGAAA